MKRSLVLLLYLICPSLSFIAYNCDVDNPNITSISTLGVQPCRQIVTRPVEDQRYIQVLMPIQTKRILVEQCYVKALTYITRCAGWEDAQVVKKGLSDVVIELTPEECHQVHLTKKYLYLDKHLIKDLKVNSSQSYSFEVSGSAGREGDCVGATFRYKGITYPNSVAQVSLTVILSVSYANLEIDDNKIHLSGGLTCKYDDGSCLDYYNGISRWDVADTSTCHSGSFLVIYEGFATKSSLSAETYGLSDLYIVNNTERVFALRVKSPTSICMFSGYKTEHPRLFVLETGLTEEKYFNTKVTEASQVDLFLYVNNKFIFVEHHISEQFKNLHIALEYQRCEMERSILNNLLSLAQVSPNIFAYTYMRKPGYIGSPAGEAVDIIACEAVDVSIRPTTRCYEELPVTYNNEEFFMTPRNRIIRRLGQEKACAPILMSKYQINGAWYTAHPSIHAINTPTQLHPQLHLQWSYQSIKELATSGIYTDSELTLIRKQLKYPNERDALEHIIIRGSMDDDIDLQGVQFGRLISPLEFEERSKTAWDKTVGGIKTVTGFLGSFVLLLIGIKIFAYIFSVILRSVDLRHEYRNNVSMLASVLDSTTLFAINRKRRTKDQDIERESEQAPIISSTDNKLQEIDNIYPVLPTHNSFRPDKP